MGGQISYAVQNIHVRNSRLAWGSLSPANRERLSLAVLLAICRGFRECKPPLSVAQLSAAVRLPSQVLNECLNRIVDVGFVMPLPPVPGTDAVDVLYQPARPLSRISLLEFKLAAETRGLAPPATLWSGSIPSSCVSGPRSSISRTTGSSTSRSRNSSPTRPLPNKALPPPGAVPSLRTLFPT